MAKKYLIKQVRTLSDNDINYFVDKMRPIDKREMACITNRSYEQELKESIENSVKCYAAIGERQEPLALFGIIDCQEQGGMIWCVGTIYLEEYKKQFVKVSRDIIGGWLMRYKRLFNSVATFNVNSIKWLKSLGAKFTKTFIADVSGEEFMFFEIKGERKNV